jgi:hypothetical protein
MADMTVLGHHDGGRQPCRDLSNIAGAAPTAASLAAATQVVALTDVLSDVVDGSFFELSGATVARHS